MKDKIAIIIGAGPAGLTAAYELLDKTDIRPIIFEASGEIGGISKTVNYKGNRIDIGGHRFFSKSDRIMKWWQNIMPLQGAPAKDDLILDRKVPLSKKVILRYLGEEKADIVEAPDPQKKDKVMLVRNRLSRIFYMRKFFDYPISLSRDTIANLGPIRTIKIGFSYLKAKLFPISHERSLEDFFINRFGKELYETFFKDYTEKVWGVPCNKIKPEWGAQRIKGLSISKVIAHALKKPFVSKRMEQQNVETSLIERFLYPKFGPGQMWEEVARQIKDSGGEIYLNHRVVGISHEKGRVAAVVVEDARTGLRKTIEGDFFFSTMPIKDLVNGMGKSVPGDIKNIANRLAYRDFITVGLLLNRLRMKNEFDIRTINGIIPDTWIYVQERDVKLGRLQIFNNWSPYMVADENKVWIGLEYFCNEGDDLWNLPDNKFLAFAKSELAKIGFANEEDVLDGVVLRVPKAYPAYFGSYDHIHSVRNYLDAFKNLFLIGRNGMHRYNNQDHSMLSAMIAVENIINGVKTKENIWNVNAEEEYLETNKSK